MLRDTFQDLYLLPKLVYPAAMPVQCSNRWLLLQRWTQQGTQPLKLLIAFLKFIMCLRNMFSVRLFSIPMLLEFCESLLAGVWIIDAGDPAGGLLAQFGICYEFHCSFSLSFHVSYSLFSLFHNYCFTSTDAAPRRLCLSTGSMTFIIYMQLVGNTTTLSQPRHTQPFSYIYYLNPRTE